jgi:hypothetical protein
MTRMSDPTHDSLVYVRAVRLSGWRAAATIAAGLAVLVAVAPFLALGFLLIVVLAAVVGAAVYYFLPNRPGRVERPRALDLSGRGTITEADYRVTNGHAGHAGGRGSKDEPSQHPDGDQS